VSSRSDQRQRWTPAQDGKNNPVIKVKFSASAIGRFASVEAFALGKHGAP
jgi:hypothetical protein